MSFLNRVWSASTTSTLKGRDESVSEPQELRPEGTNPRRQMDLVRSSIDMTHTSHVPPWTREIQPGGTRNSRASSIISTQTKYSTFTQQDDARSIDARSIDIHVAGQTFRIARDGSRITDAPPPPYSDPLQTHSLPDGRPRAFSQSRLRPAGFRNGLQAASSFRGGRPGGSSTLDHYYGESEDEEQDQGVETPRQQSRAASPVPRSRANILDPSEVDMPSPVEFDPQRLSALSDGADTPSRNWSYKAGPDTITVVPDARKLRSVSQNDLPILKGTMSSPLQRRNGVRLPTLITEAPHETGISDEGPFGKTSMITSPKVIRSAGPVLYSAHNKNVPQSPTFIGRHAQGIFPSTHRQQIPSLGSPPNIDLPSIGLPSSGSNEHHDSDGEDHTHPLPMDTENDISLHYARLMRRLDRDHRRTLHLKDKELEKLRERLNEMDIVYRQQLKSRDFVIDDLKTRLENLQDNTENMIERARNEVEDLWEGRWKNQSSKLTERMKRVEEEAEKTVERLMAEREILVDR